MLHKTMVLVEPDGVRLCIEVQYAVSTLARTLDQEFEDGAANAMSAPFTNDRHPPDMRVRQQTSGADLIATDILRQGVN